MLTYLKIIKKNDENLFYKVILRILINKHGITYTKITKSVVEQQEYSIKQKLGEKQRIIISDSFSSNLPYKKTLSSNNYYSSNISIFYKIDVGELMYVEINDPSLLHCFFEALSECCNIPNILNDFFGV